MCKFQEKLNFWRDRWTEKKWTEAMVGGTIKHLPTFA